MNAMAWRARRTSIASRRVRDRETPYTPASGDDLDLETVRINAAKDSATTGTIKLTNSRETRLNRELSEIILVRGGERETQEARLGSEMGDVHETLVAAAAHVQRRLVAGCSLHAEIGQECFRHIQVGSTESHERDVGHLHTHDFAASALSPGDR